MYTSCVYHSCHERATKNKVFSNHVIIWWLPGTQMSLVLIGKDLDLEAKQRTNGFQVRYIIYRMTTFGNQVVWVWLQKKNVLLGFPARNFRPPLVSAGLTMFVTKKTAGNEVACPPSGPQDYWKNGMFYIIIYLLYLQSCIFSAGCFSPHHLSDDLQSS